MDLLQHFSYPRTIMGGPALPIGGSTLHRAAGIGIPRCPNDFKRMWNFKNKLRNLSVLIVDEISMVSAELLDRLEEKLCEIRGSERAFGGIQVQDFLVNKYI